MSSVMLQFASNKLLFITGPRQPRLDIPVRIQPVRPATTENVSQEKPDATFQTNQSPSTSAPQTQQASDCQTPQSPADQTFDFQTPKSTIFADTDYQERKKKWLPKHLKAKRIKGLKKSQKLVGSAAQ